MAERFLPKFPKFSKAWVVLVLLSAGVVISAVGCVQGNVDIPDYYDDDDRYVRYDDDDDRWEDRDHDRDRDDDDDDDRRHRRRKHKKLKKDEARDIAEELVEARGMEVDHFKIKDKEIDGVYWMLFTHRRDKHKNRDRRRDFFAIRVARGPRGKTHVTTYMDGDRRDFGRKMEKDKVKKKEAYRFAEKLARRHGAKLGEYKIKDKKIDGNYWILFERENPRRRSWKNHFAVYVSKRGVVTFYKW
ncbi:MAG: hypothetical protein KAR11_02790 [Phycisphaerae bacterium]|nr:hypothetical protein [Phycisphaerae bacterium]